MGLIMRGIFFAIISLLFIITSNVYGAWQGPMEVIIGNWGKGDRNFGIERGDLEDKLPLLTAITIEEKMIISDRANEREIVYSSDESLYKIIPWYLYRDDKKIVNPEFPKYNYWNIQGYTPEGNIWVKFDKYHLKSPTGQLLETYKERPLELGLVKEKRSGSKRYKVTIKYPDKEWVVISKGACSRYVRDLNCNLYCPGHRQVIKYDEDGNEAARLTMPERIAEETPARDPGVEAIIKVIEEYGPPVVSPNGDIYAWKRTPDTYSIVKWIWQGPKYAPQSLKVASSKTGLNLTWKPPIYEAKYVKEYEIVRSDEICGQFAPISTVSKNTLKYEDKDVSEGTNYCYKVSAIKASGSSEYSNKAAGKISVSQTTSQEVTGNAYSKVEKDILAGKTINKARLHSFNKNELKLLRNTVFAKYGRTFKSDMLKTWFAKKDWYNADPNYSDKVLTDTDKKNITTFLNLEKKK